MPYDECIGSIKLGHISPSVGSSEPELDSRWVPAYVLLANPKSRTLACPRLVMKMLAGFISR